MSNQDKTFELAKELLDKHGYVFIQSKGEKDTLTKEQLAELDKIAHRVIGFDNMFTSNTFRTVTYVTSLEGFKNFLEVDICKRFVKEVHFEEVPVSNGTIYASSPKLYLHLNTSHERCTQFKSTFIGRGGSKIKSLSEYIKCSISLVDTKEVE